MIQGQPVGLYCGCVAGHCNGDNNRLTVAMLICIDECLLMVRPSMATVEGHANWWVLPQEGYEFKDANIPNTVDRGMQEEFGYSLPRDDLLFAKILGCIEDYVPTHRSRNAGVKKKIVFVGIRTNQFPIELNEENVAYRYVSSWSDLDNAMSDVAEHRVEKYTGTCEAVLRACKCGILPWKIPKGL